MCMDMFYLGGWGDATSWGHISFYVLHKMTNKLNRIINNLKFIGLLFDDQQAEKDADAVSTADDKYRHSNTASLYLMLPTNN